MGKHTVLFFCAMFIFASIILVATSSNGVSNTFEVYAADNCDTTSTCINSGSPSNIQNNDCIVNSGCGNFANRDSNTQNNNCRTSNCVNDDLSSQGSNTQTNTCRSNSFCFSVATGGSSNTQTTTCD